MKTVHLLAVAIVTVAGLPLMAQKVGTSAAQAAAKDSATHSAQMQPVKGELVRSLNSKSARVGQPVVLRTTVRTWTARGDIPKGSRLLGRVTKVQAHSKKHRGSLIGIAFDRMVLKTGQSFTIHSKIESVSKPRWVLAGDWSEETAAGEATNFGPQGSALAAAHMAGGRIGHDIALNADAAGGKIGVGSVTEAYDTNIPGVMLHENTTGTASGVLSAARKNFTLLSGTQMVVKIVAAGK